MSAPASSSPSPGEMFGYFIQGVMYVTLGFLIYFLIASIYYKFNQDDVPPDWWPTKLTGWVHDFPPEYSMVANVYVNGTVSNTFTANVLSAEECAYGTDKAAGCNDVEKCIGFIFKKAVAPSTANTCTLYSSIAHVASPITSTPAAAATVTTPAITDMYKGDYYVFAGTENPLYNVYSAKTFTAVSTLTASTVTGGSAQDVIDACLKICNSNVTCTGVTLVTTVVPPITAVPAVGTTPAIVGTTVATMSGQCTPQTAEILDTSMTALTAGTVFKKDVSIWTAADI